MTGGDGASGQVQVVSEELRSAARSIRAAVAGVTCCTIPSDGITATSFGHDQLAEVAVEFCQKAAEVVSRTAQGDETAAGQLDQSALSYDVTDERQHGLYAGYSSLLTRRAAP